MTGLFRKLFSAKGVLITILIVSLVLLFFEYAGVFIAPAIEKKIAESLNAEIKVDDIDLDLGFSVELKNVSLIAGGNEILSSEKIELQLAFSSLLKFKPRIKRVTVKDFQIEAAYDPKIKKWNLAFLNFAKGSSQKTRLPIIHLKRGKLNIRTDLENRQDDSLIAFDGHIAPTASDKNILGFDLHVAEDSDFALSHIRGTWQIGKAGRVLLNSGQILMGTKTILGNCWNLSDTKFELTYNDDDINIEQFSTMLGEKTFFTAAGSITDRQTDPKYDLTFNLKDATVSSTSKVNSLVYSDQTFPLIHFGLVKFLKAYQPSGTGDIDIHCSGLVKDIKTNSWQGKITSKDASVRHIKFPYLIEKIAGVIELSDGSVKLNDLNSKHDDVDIAIGGFYKKTPSGSLYDFKITSPNLSFDQSLYQAINTRAKKMWWSFTPQGKAKVLKRFARLAEDDKPINTLEIELLNASANYEHFPYQLENLTGKVIVDPGTVQIENLVTNYGDNRKITLTGSVKGTNTEKPQYNVSVDAINIPIDKRLMAALPKSQQRFYKHFEVDALTDVHIKVLPGNTDKRPVEYIADVSIKDAAITYNRFPVPLKQVNLDATLTADKFVLKKITARNQSATVEISGAAWPPENPEDNAGLCLKINAANLELKPEWVDKLEGQWLTIISQFQPGGPVDIDANINLGAKGNECGQTRIVFDCLGNTIRHKKFPFPIDGIIGQVVITEDSIELKDISANTNGYHSPGKLKLGGKLTAANGFVNTGSLALTATDLEIDETFVNALPEKHRQAIAPLAPAGSVDLDISKISFIETSTGEKLMDIDGIIEPNNLTIGKTFKAEDISGRLDFKTQYQFGLGLDSLSADYDINSFRLRQQRVNNLTGTVAYDKETKTLSSKEFTATNGQGVSIGNAEITFADPDASRYNVEVMFDGLDMGSIIATDTAEKNTGTINGQVNVTGRTGINKERTGRLNLKVVDMKMAKRSFMAKVLTAMQLDDPTDHTFTDMVVESYLNDDLLRFSKINVSGKSGVFQGGGTLMLNTGQIDLDLSAYGKVLTANPSLLESLARGIGSAVIKVEVDGTIDQPQVKVTPLPIIQGSIEILGGTGTN